MLALDGGIGEEESYDEDYSSVCRSLDVLSGALCFILHQRIGPTWQRSFVSNFLYLWDNRRYERQQDCEGI